MTKTRLSLAAHFSMTRLLSYGLWCVDMHAISRLRIWIMVLSTLCFGQFVHAAGACNTNNGPTMIGVEASSTGGRFLDGSFYYDYAMLQCINGAVVEWNGTSFSGTPSSLWQAANSTHNMTLFSNACGSHIIAVDNYYIGTLNGYPAHGKIMTGMLYLNKPSFACAGPDINPDLGCPKCGKPPANSPPPPSSDGTATVADPIHIGNGNVYENEVDWVATGPSPLRIGRHYNSEGQSGAMAVNWRTEYDKRILTLPTNILPLQVCRWDFTPTAFGGLFSGNDSPTSTVDTCPNPPPVEHPPVGALAYRENGKVINFPPAGGNDLNGFNLALTSVNGQWQLTDDENNVELYNANGYLQSITYRNGVVVTLVYGANNQIATVTDSFGKQLTYTYNAKGQVTQITDPDGNPYLYTDDQAGNLVQVTYPDNSTRQYLYENATFFNSLTAIIDENGARYSSWTFDGQGRAISNQIGSSSNFNVTYGVGPNQVSDISPLGLTRTATLQTILGRSHITSSSLSCTGCPSNSYQLKYDANGNIISRTDYRGVTTTYTYDTTRNLELSRTEAVGTPQQRVITTQWHSTFRLPVQIVDPIRTTTFQYDSQGNLLKESVIADGKTRSWQNTYNSLGQITQATDPLGHSSNYTYDSSGNLLQMTDAAGHTTHFSQYDADGNVGAITDVNGNTTLLSYDPRGRLVKRVLGSEVTQYGYDHIGQLLKVTRPDGSWVSYQYDDAHRLVGVRDSIGNQISYTLDAIGDRVNEVVTDPNGSLALAMRTIENSINPISSYLLSWN